MHLVNFTLKVTSQKVSGNYSSIRSHYNISNYICILISVNQEFWIKFSPLLRKTFRLILVTQELFQKARAKWPCHLAAKANGGFETINISMHHSFILKALHCLGCAVSCLCISFHKTLHIHNVFLSDLRVLTRNLLL